MKPATTPTIIAMLVLLALHSAPAQVPSLLNYQGRVTVGGTNLTVNAAQFKFALVNGDGSAVYWRNDGATAAGDPATAVAVDVAQGLYSVLLGDTGLANMAAIPSGVFTNPDVNLRVWFSPDGGTPFVRLSPDQRLGASGYALRAASVDVPGENNTPAGAFSVVGGGVGNTAAGEWSTVGGGTVNTAASLAATVSGGYENTAGGAYSMVAGGYGNQAGDDSFAAGILARATNAGAFVWSGYYDESETVTTVSTNDYSFTVRSPGGARFLTTTATNAFVGVILTNAATAWASLSDSNAKTGIRPIDPRAVLAKVDSLPVSEWEYKHDPARRYFGPMSQDFHAAFGLGRDDKTINTLDADGVLFLSVKGLVAEIKLRDEKIAQLEAWSREQGARSRAEIEELQAQNEQLSRKIEAIDQRLNAMPPAP